MPTLLKDTVTLGSHGGKVGRPRADPTKMTASQERTLRYKREHPEANLAQTAKAVGLGDRIIYRWREVAADERRPGHGPARVWLAAWKLIEQVAAGAPPKVPKFSEWRERYVNVPTYNPTTGRRQMVGVTYDYMRETMEALSDPTIDLLAIVWPVRWAKSTMMEQWVAYNWCVDPEFRQLWVSANTKHLRERADAIKRFVQDNELYPELHNTWGPWIGRPDDRRMPWSATSFSIRGRRSPERAPSFSGYGFTSRTYGARADRIIIDDADDPSYGEQERDSIYRKINGDLLTRLNDGGKIVYIGTRCGPYDVIERLKGNPRWKIITVSAEDAEGESVCPEMYSTEDLRQMREVMGAELYALMVLNDPMAVIGGMFPATLIEQSKAHVEIGDVPADWKRLISFDPAASGSGRAAGVGIGYNPVTGEARVMAVEEGAGGYEGCFEMIQRLVARVRPTTAVIEATGGSTYIHEYPQVERYLMNEGCYEIVPFKTHSGNKSDPEIGIGLVKAFMQRGKLRIPWGSEAAMHECKPLIDDLLGWKPKMKRKRYDTVMALWFGISYINGDLDVSGGNGAPAPLDPLYRMKGGAMRRFR